MRGHLVEGAPNLWRQLDVLAGERSAQLRGSARAHHGCDDAGLVDESHLFVYPVVVGEGKPAFSRDARLQLELQEERRFGNGVVYLRYRTQS